MRLLIASDIHGSLSKIKAFAEKAGQMSPDMIILLGDILYHGPRNPLPENYSPAEVIKVLAEMPAPIAAIMGNCDAEVDEMVLPFHLADNSWIIDKGRRILAIHGHQLEINDGTIKAPANAAVLSGHTHIPTAEKRDETNFWNPGSISLPKQNFPPSFGLYENGEFKVLTFDGSCLMSDTF